MLTDFGVEAAASLLGAFAGVFLALVADRRLRAERERARSKELADEFARTKRAVLGSIVKNTAEARRVKEAVARPGQWEVPLAALETGIWEASRDTFVRLSPTVEERAAFAMFFDEVLHLDSFVRFYRDLAVRSRETPAGAGVLEAAERELQNIAEQVRLSGVLLVTDHGESVHRRVAGIGS